MPDSQLTGLQEAILRTLAESVPDWTLTGGAALAGFHLGHRVTRDLDLFWRGCTELGDRQTLVRSTLERAGFTVEALQTAVSFVRLRVSDSADSVVVDLVADPVATIEDSVPMSCQGVLVRLDSTHEILVNKLCALLSRVELRDLVDVRALLAIGGDFDRALADAPKKDGGFSPLTLAWLLRDFDIEALTRLAGGPTDEGLVAFRDELIERLTEGCAPDG